MLKETNNGEIDLKETEETQPPIKTTTNIKNISTTTTTTPTEILDELVI
jgi:hypothetical protein